MQHYPILSIFRSRSIPSSIILTRCIMQRLHIIDRLIPSSRDRLWSAAGITKCTCFFACIVVVNITYNVYFCTLLALWGHCCTERNPRARGRHGHRPPLTPNLQTDLDVFFSCGWLWLTHTCFCINVSGSITWINSNKSMFSLLCWSGLAIV